MCDLFNCKEPGETQVPFEVIETYVTSRQYKMTDIARGLVSVCKPHLDFHLPWFVEQRAVTGVQYPTRREHND